MKVLHYCNLFSPVSQTFIYDVIIQLDSIGVSNVVVANKLVDLKGRPYDKVHELPSFNDNMIKRGWRVLKSSLGMAEDYKGLNNLQIHRLKALSEIVKKLKPDLIHAHFGPQGIQATAVAEDLQIPSIVSFHGFDAFRDSKIADILKLYRKIFEKATFITVVSELMKKHLIGLGCPPSKLAVIHVGKKIDDYGFKNEINIELKSFVSIGRLAEKKGHDDAIRAFKRLKSRYPALTLKIIGEGKMESSLRNLIEAEKLQDNVHLLGSLDHDKTKQILREADAFILSSKTAVDGDSEGIPTVLMEAQAMGVPCISTFHSGIPEVIPIDNHWMLAQEADIESLESTIEKVLLAPVETIQNARRLGRKKVEQEFNLATEVSKLERLYMRATKTQELLV